MDVLRETWEEPTPGNKNVISYVLRMRDRLAEMTEVVHENLSQAQQAQKQWYDRTACSRHFSPGDRVLVLLPTSTHKLRAQWQGPYTIMEKRGEVNYVVDMGDRQKRLRTFHVNMLRLWQDSKPLALYTEEIPDEEPEDIIWCGEGEALQPVINAQLPEDHKQEMGALLPSTRTSLIPNPE